ncbi:MAG: electron transfer flavoprotein subunit alpha/FixB family protein [Thaumarchaeota archaeon]|nr:electron transfer flavoprotein subunit alpha/FixB family protein [Nitrososphaerota archaeon]
MRNARRGDLRLSAEPKDVWVYLQHTKSGLTSDSYEVLAAGRKVADKLGQKVVAILIGLEVGSMAKEAVAYGSDEVLYVDDPAYETYFNLRYIDAISAMVAERRPYAFLFVANELGKDLAARIAFRAGTGLATDNVQLEVEDYTNPVLGSFKDLLIQVRPDFGTRLARIYTPRHRPQMATIRAGNFAPLRPDQKRRGKMERFVPPVKEYPAKVKEVVELPPPEVDLRGADVVISLGLGVLKDGSGRPRDPREAYQYALKLKDAVEKRHHLKVEVGATRALIYAEVKELEGLIDKANQVGQTGTTVNPQLYFAVGISGALQHRVGMRGSQKIVAINTDPSAPIFKIAHYPIVGDLYEELPKLIELIGGGVTA